MAPIRIRTVDLAVAVRILRIESCKTIGSLLSNSSQGVNDRRRVTKQFGAVVNGAVAVTVHHQEPIVSTDPASTALDAVRVVVEVDWVGSGGRNGFDAVAVEV